MPLTPPPNPNADAARAAMREYNGASIDYRLTWPAAQAAVCCVAGQWRRNAAGEIEAWYSREQLGDVLIAMQRRSEAPPSDVTAAMQAAGGHDAKHR